jgi:UDP-N-acetylmuramate--alanine ligase
MNVPPLSVKRIHFVGIGGIGMSGIAEVLLNLGFDISGSDIQESTNILRLRQRGAKITVGHDAANVADAQVVVVSTDIKEGNVEVLAAKHKRIPVIRRAEMLSELMRFKYAVAICGTHGKTTTTSLSASLFDAAGLDPTVVNGGIINAYGTNARLGAGDWIVVEADESDGSFLTLLPTIAVVTNIDPEHMDFYGSFEALKQSFVQYVERVPFYGLGILCLDHPVVREILPQLANRRTVTYGFAEDANVRGTNLRFSAEGILFDVDIVGNGALSSRALAGDRVAVLPRKIKDLFLPMMGQHNVQNALSVVAIAQELGLNDDCLRQAFSQFKGVKRRFTCTGVAAGVTVIDDYAHHPVEIKTVLQAARQACSGQIIAVVQPHRYSRLQNLFEEFTQCFDLADTVIVAPVYGARETPIEGVNAEVLAQAIKNTGKRNIETIQSSEELAPLIQKYAQPGDMVICLGAGNITQWAADLPSQLEAIIAPFRDASSS